MLCQRTDAVAQKDDGQPQKRSSHRQTICRVRSLRSREVTEEHHVDRQGYVSCYLALLCQLGFCPFAHHPTVRSMTCYLWMAISIGHAVFVHSSAPSCARPLPRCLVLARSGNAHESHCWKRQTSLCQRPSIGSLSTGHTRCRSMRLGRSPLGVLGHASY